MRKFIAPAVPVVIAALFVLAGPESADAATHAGRAYLGRA